MKFNPEFIKLADSLLSDKPIETEEPKPERMPLEMAVGLYTSKAFLKQVRVRLAAFAAATTNASDIEVEQTLRMVEPELRRVIAEILEAVAR